MSEAPGAPIAVEVPADLRHLVQLYLDTRRRDVARAREALAAGDFAPVRAIGHNLRGSSASYGFAEAGEIGAAIVAAAEARDAHALAGLVDRLADYLGRVEVRFR